MIYDVTVYPEAAEKELLWGAKPGTVTVAPLWRNTGSMLWTDEPLLPADHAPASLTINTKAARHVFACPKLVWISHTGMLLSAFSDEGPSGTIRRASRVFVLLEAA